MALLEIFAVVICFVNGVLIQSVLHRIKEVADHVQKQFDEVLDRLDDALENGRQNVCFIFVVIALIQQLLSNILVRRPRCYLP